MKNLAYVITVVILLLMTTQVPPANAQPQCVTCISSAQHCYTDFGPIGWYACGCGGGGCDCNTQCGLQFSSIEDVLEKNREIPPSGATLAEVPAASFLEGLDQAKARGVLVENVYFGDSFGLVLYPGSVRIFPLETRDKFALRNCDGGFRSRFYREKASS